MRFERVEMVRAALFELDSTAKAMEAVVIPRMFGRAEAVDAARALAENARTQAEDAVRLAQDLQFAPESIEQARAAIRALGDVPMNQEAVREAGTTWRSIANDLSSARADADVAFRNKEIDEYVAPRGITWLVRDFVRKDPSTLRPDEWHLMSEVLARHGTDEKFARLVYLVANGVRTVDHNVRRSFDRVRIAGLDDELYVRTAASLLEMQPRGLDRVSWSALAAILDDPRSATLLPRLPERAGSSSFVEAVDAAARWDGTASEPLLSAFAEFQSASRAQLELTIGAFTSNLSETQKLAAAQALGIESEVGGLVDVRRALDLIVRNAPDTSGQPPEIAAISRRTTELARQNLARMDGELVDGYGSFPDYAELGRIRENFILLDRLQGLERSGAGATATAVHAPPSAADAMLSW